MFACVSGCVVNQLDGIMRGNCCRGTSGVVDIPGTFVAAVNAIVLPEATRLLSSRHVSRDEHCVRLSVACAMVVNSTLTFKVTTMTSIFSIIF